MLVGIYELLYNTSGLDLWISSCHEWMIEQEYLNGRNRTQPTLWGSNYSGPTTKQTQVDVYLQAWKLIG